MSKIVLDSVVSGYDLSKINANFQKIQTELNDKVLYRNPPTGEPNTLEKDVDANGFSILNLGGLSIEGYDDFNTLAEQATLARDEAVAAKNVVIGIEDDFTDVYLGNKSADPILDNDGEELVEGSFYFNVALSPKRLRVYTGVEWQDVAAATVNNVNTIDSSLYASQAEAEAGINNVKVITPLTAKQSILVNAATLAQGALADSSLQPDDVGTTAGKLVALDGSAKLPAVDGSQLTNLPSTSFPTQTGNANKVLKTDGTNPLWDSPLTSGTAINTTSGTAHDFTGIPSWVKRITLSLRDVSLNGSDFVRVQLGTSGGVITTGYSGLSCFTGTSGIGANLFSAGFDSYGDSSASNLRSGTLTFSRLSANVWTCSGSLSQHSGSPVFTITFAGSIDLGAAITTLRVTGTAGGTFDNGSINILYE